MSWAEHFVTKADVHFWNQNKIYLFIILYGLYKEKKMSSLIRTIFQTSFTKPMLTKTAQNKKCIF